MELNNPRRRQQCNEACLDRIAAHLRELNNAPREDVANTATDKELPPCVTAQVPVSSFANRTGCCSPQSLAQQSGEVSTRKEIEHEGCGQVLSAGCHKKQVLVVGIPSSSRSEGCCSKQDVTIEPRIEQRSVPGCHKTSNKSSADCSKKASSGCCAALSQVANVTFNNPSTSCCANVVSPIDSSSSETSDDCCADPKATSAQSNRTLAVQCFTSSENVVDFSADTTYAGGCCGKTDKSIDSSQNIQSGVGCCGKSGRKLELSPTEQPINNRTSAVPGTCCAADCACCPSEPVDTVKDKDFQAPLTSETCSVDKIDYTVCIDECCAGDNASVESASYTVDTDLDRAMAKYASMLRRGQCLCRRAIAQLGFNCCGTPSTSAAVGASKAAKKLSQDFKLARTSIENVHGRCTSTAATIVKTSNATFTEKRIEVDIEKQADCEHIVLNVTGMTCTGCSKKLMNVITPIEGVSNPHVTFVSGKAEFDYGASKATGLDVVLRRIEQETGFKLSRVVSGRQNLNVFMSVATAERMHQNQITGVISLIHLKRDEYCITYDPSIVGARSLLEMGPRLAPPSPEARMVEDKRHLRKTALNTALAAILTIPVLVLEWSESPVPRRTRAITTAILATLVQLIAVPEFYVGAVKSLVFSRVVEMDMLVVISITAAYVYSMVAFGLEEAGMHLDQEAFFETSTLLITLVMLGRLIAAWARMRAIATVSLRSLQVQTAALIRSDGQSEDVDARLLQYNDKIIISAHARIVTDGEVISGTSEVDESMITGESCPVLKGIGDKVIAGTLNGPGTLSVLLTRLPGENSITDIARLVEDAVASKPKVQELADKIASWFIPVVLIIAAIVCAIWIAVAVRIRKMAGGDAMGLAMTYAVAVLAISCPCAIGLAVPMVLVITGGVAARSGIIIKAADAIERATKLTDAVFDKTGTLTEGSLQVVALEQIASTRFEAEKVISWARAIVEGHKHPVAVSVAHHLLDLTPEPTRVVLEGITSIPGAGLEAAFEDHFLRAGNPSWLQLENHPAIVDRLGQGMTLFCLTIDDELVLVCGLTSNIRSNASFVVGKLLQRGIRCHIVSGDNVSAVSQVARSLDIPSDLVAAQTTPAGKQRYVQTLQNNGKKVLFIGDGTNDAVAIAQADVGMQMGSASDVIGAVAGVVLMSGNLQGVLNFLDLSGRSLRRIAFNFGWSAVYNFFAILMTSGAFVKFRIPPRFAGLGEMISVLPVIVAAATLLVRSEA